MLRNSVSDIMLGHLSGRRVVVGVLTCSVKMVVLIQVELGIFGCCWWGVDDTMVSLVACQGVAVL